jgi:hypothetical protein
MVSDQLFSRDAIARWINEGGPMPGRAQRR